MGVPGGTPPKMVSVQKLLALTVVNLFFLVNIGCYHISNTKPPRKLSPEWWDIKQARSEGHTLPAIYIVFNDHQIGWLYNQGEKFSDEKFMAYIYGLEITKRCKEVRFIYGINLHQKEVIRCAVLYFD
jgi:hypothetical protein